VSARDPSWPLLPDELLNPHHRRVGMSWHRCALKTPLLAIVAMCAMLGPVEKPLDNGMSTHQWACAPVKGLTATVPSSSLARRSPALSLARCGAEERGGRGENEG
jgi:hypothetical protein